MKNRKLHDMNMPVWFDGTNINDVCKQCFTADTCNRENGGKE